MAHSLDMEVIGEGIESKEQMEFLAANGCDLGQGYFFARPMSADAFTAFSLNGPTIGTSEP